MTPEQRIARENFMKLWHEELPRKYSAIEDFNHGFSVNLGLPPTSDGKCKTLEIGAGLGGHLPFENLELQDYYCLDYREEFCKVLRTRMDPARVLCGDIQTRLPWNDNTFDRIVSIHILEHLTDLPKALDEVSRLLKPDGVFDVVIPCEGGVAYSLARRISAQRLFEKNFKMSYTPIIRAEHLSSFSEIVTELAKMFEIKESQYFPLRIPIPTINLVMGLRLKKRTDNNP